MRPRYQLIKVNNDSFNVRCETCAALSNWKHSRAGALTLQYLSTLSSQASLLKKSRYYVDMLRTLLSQATHAQICTIRGARNTVHD